MANVRGITRLTNVRMEQEFKPNSTVRKKEQERYPGEREWWVTYRTDAQGNLAEEIDRKEIKPYDPVRPTTVKHTSGIFESEETVRD